MEISYPPKTIFSMLTTVKLLQSIVIKNMLFVSSVMSTINLCTQLGDVRYPTVPLLNSKRMRKIGCVMVVSKATFFKHSLIINVSYKRMKLIQT